MENEILKEIQELKMLLSKIIGSGESSPENGFSEEALKDAQKVYLKMSIERGDWVKDDHIRQFINSAPWNVGSFIRKEFAFTNWFKQGHNYLYNKKDLIALNEELTARNIDLNRYREFLEDKAAFDRRMLALENPQKRNPKGKPFVMPSAKVKNITTSEIPKPLPDLVRADLSRLKEEFKSGKFASYIDIYKGTHAMVKHIYFYEKYLEPGLKRKCRKWCEDFNYANHALELITGKKEKFKVEDPTMIQL